MALICAEINAQSTHIPLNPKVDGMLISQIFESTELSLEGQQNCKSNVWEDDSLKSFQKVCKISLIN